MEIAKYKEFLMRNRILLQTKREELDRVKGEISTCEKLLDDLRKASEVVSKVSVMTLHETKVFIQESISLCLAVVYGDEYCFELDYQMKRGRPEAQIYIVKNGERLDPRQEVGGGVVDVASLGMRLALWVLSNPRTNPTFILDEPFRFVSTDLTHKVVKMLDELCKSFNAQMIIVSHNSEMIDGAEKTVHVSQESGVSSVTSE